MAGYKTNSGRNLQKKWNIPAKKVHFHKDGTFFMPLDEFPGALCDPNGYVLFKSREEYEASSYLRRGVRLNVSSGINAMPKYKRMI